MEENKLKIGIVGLGSIGLVLAVTLQEAGCNVIVCDYDKVKMNKIRNEGIKIVGTYEKTAFMDYNYSSVSELLEHDVDILISAVKSYRVDNLLDQIQRYNRKDMYLLCAQNGIDIGLKYTSHFKESQILRMVINFAGVLSSPNETTVTFFEPPNYIASINDSHPEISEQLATLMTKAGMQTVSTDSFTITNHVWAKTILIASISPLCGISNIVINEALKNPDTLEIVEQIIMESLEVAKAEGINLGPNISKLLLRSLKISGNHLPSIAVDLLNCRETEIDYINGKIVEFGRKHYIQTPLNLIFTNLVRAISKKNSGCLICR